ncbi:MAG TPA: hypothetical protein VKZ60_07135 [Chloroflexota bacterium]|jgi:hypothetical protein|nr:hypothetical protein [Chloroflexota bacterium]
MSLPELERVMARALRDEAFRLLLRTAPDEALAEYELTAEERAVILGSATAAPPAEDPRS